MGASVGVTVGGFVAVAVGNGVAVGQGVLVAVFVGWMAAIRFAVGVAAGAGRGRNPRQFKVSPSHRDSSRISPHLNTLAEPVRGGRPFSLIKNR